MPDIVRFLKNKLRARAVKKLRSLRAGCDCGLWGKAPVFDQRAYTKKTGTFGIFGNLYANGCGLMAIHNANVILGRNINLAKTYLHFHKKAFLNTLCGGLLGTSPSAVRKYFTHAGFKVSYIKNFGRLNNAHNAYIIVYAWKKGKKVGMHYVAMEFDSDKNSYKVYNDGAPVKYYADPADLIKEDGIIAYRIMAIDK